MRNNLEPPLANSKAGQDPTIDFVGALERPSGGDVGRLVAKALVAAVMSRDERTPMILVIDEWQSVVNSQKGETDE
jgi:hypothetical protein